MIHSRFIFLLCAINFTNRYKLFALQYAHGRHSVRPVVSGAGTRRRASGGVNAGVRTMLIWCKYCGGRHERGTVCAKAPKRRGKYYEADTDAGRFRNTQRWKDKTEAIKERDFYLCRLCLHNKIITKTGLSVHHIEPIETHYDLRLDDDNLITLCARCHARAESNNNIKTLLQELARVPPGEGR